MRITRVIHRFLSLLDVAMILLGVLMITLMHAQFRSATKPVVNPLSQAIDFVYLYVGWKGEYKNKCFLLGPDFGIGPEVRTDSSSDIKRILDSRGKGKPNQIILLLFSEKGWYAGWDSQKYKELEETWGVKFLPIYNVPIDK